MAVAPLAMGAPVEADGLPHLAHECWMRVEVDVGKPQTKRETLMLKR